MKEQFATYEIAFKLQEKGFDEPCFMYWNPKVDGSMQLWFSDVEPLMMICTAPLWQQVLEWLRVKHDMHIIIKLGYGSPTWYSYHIQAISSDIESKYHDSKDSYNSYNQALKAAIEHALNII